VLKQREELRSDAGRVLQRLGNKVGLVWGFSRFGGGNGWWEGGGRLVRVLVPAPGAGVLVLVRVSVLVLARLSGCQVEGG